MAGKLSAHKARVSVALPKELLKTIDEVAKKSGETRTSIVRSCLDIGILLEPYYNMFGMQMISDLKKKAEAFDGKVSSVVSKAIKARRSH